MLFLLRFSCFLAVVSLAVLFNTDCRAQEADSLSQRVVDAYYQKEAETVSNAYRNKDWQSIQDFYEARLVTDVSLKITFTTKIGGETVDRQTLEFDKNGFIAEAHKSFEIALSYDPHGIDIKEFTPSEDGKKAQVKVIRQESMDTMLPVAPGKSIEATMVSFSECHEEIHLDDAGNIFQGNGSCETTLEINPKEL